MNVAAATADIDPKTLNQALEWLVTLWSREGGDTVLHDLSVWRAADPRHERAWQHVQRLETRLASLPVQPAAMALRTARRNAASRRVVLRSLVLLMFGGLSAYGLRQIGVVQRRFAALQTAVGEIRELQLDDGTRLTLNTDTAVDQRYTDTERRLHLLAGELLIESAADTRQPPRPFVIETAEGLIRPIGTRFTVRQLDGVSRVAVLDGAVSVQPHHAADTQRLDAGRVAAFTADAVGETQANDPLATAWTRRMLVVEQMRLADFLAELERYRPGRIRCAPAVADFKVSGAYPLADTERVLTALAQALPLRIGGLGRYWTTVEPRDDAV